MPENAFIKSVKLEGNESPDGLLDLSRGVKGANVRVTLSRNGGRVEGSVLDAEGEPRIPLAHVNILASADDTDRIDRESARIVAAGEKFSFSGLRPGRYRLIATDARQSPVSVQELKALFPKAPEIEIREGDRVARDVKVMSVERPDGHL
jgi:hypothetical protein